MIKIKELFAETRSYKNPYPFELFKGVLNDAKNVYNSGVMRPGQWPGMSDVQFLLWFYFHIWEKDKQRFQSASSMLEALGYIGLLAFVERRWNQYPY